MVELAAQAWRLTSVTTACADTDIGTAGRADRKSRCSTWSPMASVLPAWVNVRAPAPVGPGIHQRW
jgi:hypothetical protein